MASIRKRGNSYQISVSNGRDISGKQIFERTTFTPPAGMTDKQTEKAVNSYAVKFEEKVKSGQYLSGEKMTLVDFIEEWKKQAKGELRITYYEKVVDALDRFILPNIGHMLLSKITPLHVRNLVDKWISDGYTVNGKHMDYAPATIRRLLLSLQSPLEYAVDMNIITENPCHRVRPPKLNRKNSDIKSFNIEEAQRFLEYIEKPYTIAYHGKICKDGNRTVKYLRDNTVSYQLQVFYNICMFGGCRAGEVLALTWDDIDFQNNAISIAKSTSQTKTAGMITKETKTGDSRRVNFPDTVMQMLKKHRAEQDEYRLSLGTAWRGENHLFTQYDGKQMYYSSPMVAFSKIIARHNATVSEEEKLPVISLHGLRHTAASLLIAQNMDIKTVSQRLGHKQTSTTLNIYAHALEKMDVKAATVLEDILTKKPVSIR